MVKQMRNQTWYLASLLFFEFFFGAHAKAIGLADCKKEWEPSLGPLVEMPQSPLDGYWQVRQVDGNSMFISKKCDNVFVGEMFLKGEVSKSKPPVDSMDRSELDFEGLIAIGSPGSGAWIFVMSNADLAEFGAWASEQAKLRKEGYYVGLVAERSAAPCRFDKVEDFAKAGAGAECGLSLNEGLALLSAHLPFAISPSGDRLRIGSWMDFFRVFKLRP